MRCSQASSGMVSSSIAPIHRSGRLAAASRSSGPLLPRRREATAQRASTSGVRGRAPPFSRRPAGRRSGREAEVYRPVSTTSPRHRAIRAGSGMANVFVSYARADVDFVRHLHDALLARACESWVDWDDIPPSAEWLKEVFSGIEGSDTFVFVISPDSVQSPVCKIEIAHAVAHNKRIVPAVARQTDVS